MDTKFMSRSAGVYNFKIARRLKHSKHGKNNPLMEFHEFEENLKLCPVKCLDEYINRTEQTRKDINTLSLFISMVKPFHPVTSQPISRWILASSGIDTKRFKAHAQKGVHPDPRHNPWDSTLMTFLRWETGPIRVLGLTTIRNKYEEVMHRTSKILY